MLIAVSLLAMIMTSVALAMQGAASANRYGADKSRSLTQATIALSRISADLRRANSVQVHSNRILVLSFTDGEQRWYYWSGASGAPVQMYSTVTPQWNVLIPEMNQFQVVPTMAYSEVRQAVVAVSVNVVLDVRCGEADTRIETTVRPRRNIM